MRLAEVGKSQVGFSGSSSDYRKVTDLNSRERATLRSQLVAGRGKARTLERNKVRATFAPKGNRSFGALSSMRAKDLDKAPDLRKIGRNAYVSRGNAFDQGHQAATANAERVFRETKTKFKRPTVIHPDASLGGLVQASVEHSGGRKAPRLLSVARGPDSIRANVMVHESAHANAGSRNRAAQLASTGRNMAEEGRADAKAVRAGYTLEGGLYDDAARRRGADQIRSVKEYMRGRAAAGAPVPARAPLSGVARAKGVAGKLRRLR